jgi:hypothetical protein
MQAAGLNADIRELIDSVESSIVSGHTTDAQASRLFMALIADKIEKLTITVAQLHDSR